ncbi:MAG: endonuclease [Gammaproteobacteria bacterium]|nr:endonuclease [Gammaproteobacteria bacterium]
MREFWGILLVCALAIGACQADQTGIKDYEEARQVFWSKLYANGGETLYCAVPFDDRNRYGLNIEHVFPMSWVTSSLRCGRRAECRERNPRFNRIEADLHNLFPSRRVINAARASFRFGDIGGERRDFGSCDFEVDDRQRIVEPRPAVRGEIARAMFYMQEEYGLVIFRRLGHRLLGWHRADPPDAEERRRNDEIEKLQGTRNRFIDRPELADTIRFDR